MTDAIDTFAGFSATPDDPFTSAGDVTLSDTNDLFIVSRGLHIPAPGDTAFPVRVTMKDGATVTLYLKPGLIHSLRVTRVWMTGTFPDLPIVALW